MDIEFEIMYDGENYFVDVSLDVQTSEWGADADGNRGVLRTEWELDYIYVEDESGDQVGVVQNSEFDKLIMKQIEREVT